MSSKEKYIHIIFEFLAIVILVPFFIHLLVKYNFNLFDKYFLIIIIIVTIIVDGYLLFTWFRNKEEFINQEKRNMINKLIRQSARWSSAAKNDKNNLIAVLHANYGAGYLWALKDIFSEREIEEVLGSEEKRKMFENEIIKIQDKMTKKSVNDCPQFSGAIDFLAKLAGEA